MIDAVQWDGLNTGEVFAFVPDIYFVAPNFEINTLEGTMTANVGDWIIKGVKGEFYPCKPEIFDATYEAVEPERMNL